MENGHRRYIVSVALVDIIERRIKSRMISRNTFFRKIEISGGMLPCLGFEFGNIHRLFLIGIMLCLRIFPCADILDRLHVIIVPVAILDGL